MSGLFSKFRSGLKRDRAARTASPSGNASATASGVSSTGQLVSGVIDPIQDAVPSVQDVVPIQQYGIASVRAEDDAKALFDIVLVHGLMGKAKDTWLHESTKTHWPRDLLTQDMSNCRILTFGYDADIVQLFGPASTSRLTNHAKTLVAFLAGLRRKTRSESRPIIFIAHSLGGLVVQHALQYSSDANGISSQSHLAQVERCTYGLVFLGVPNHGSNKAAWGLMGTKLAKGLFQRPNRQILSALKRKSELLSIVHEGFLKVIERRKSTTQEVRIACFFENIEIWGIGTIVDQQSAAIWTYPCFGIRANHIDMTKFEGSNDNGYQLVLEPLERWRDELIESSKTSFTADTNQSSGAMVDIPVPTSVEGRNEVIESMNTTRANNAGESSRAIMNDPDVQRLAAAPQTATGQAPETYRHSETFQQGPFSIYCNDEFIESSSTISMDNFFFGWQHRFGDEFAIWHRSDDMRVPGSHQPFLRLQDGVTFTFSLSASLSISIGERLVWSTPEHAVNDGACELRFTPNSNLVICVRERVVWQTGTGTRERTNLKFLAVKPYLVIENTKCLPIWHPWSPPSSEGQRLPQP